MLKVTRLHLQSSYTGKRPESIHTPFIISEESPANEMSWPFVSWLTSSGAVSEYSWHRLVLKSHFNLELMFLTTHCDLKVPYTSHLLSSMHVYEYITSTQSVLLCSTVPPSWFGPSLLPSLLWAFLLSLPEFPFHGKPCFILKYFTRYFIYLLAYLMACLSYTSQSIVTQLLPLIFLLEPFLQEWKHLQYKPTVILWFRYYYDPYLY